MGAIYQWRSDWSPQLLKDLDDSVDQVLLAIPSLPRSERRRIVDDLQKRGIGVLQVPSVDDLTSGARIDALRPIAIEDLLGRDEVPPSPSCLVLAFVMRWSASPVLVVRLARSSAARFWRCRRRT